MILRVDVEIILGIILTKTFEIITSIFEIIDDKRFVLFTSIFLYFISETFDGFFISY